jgi:hypothetical protein
MREHRSFSTFETVLIDTPAARATSSIVGAVSFLMCRKFCKTRFGDREDGHSLIGSVLLF